MCDRMAEVRNQGMAQGGPLSPLLTNILLKDGERELEKGGYALCHYAHYCDIDVGCEAAAQRLMAAMKAFLKERLKR